jgi:hypothetical protein
MIPERGEAGEKFEYHKTEAARASIRFPILPRSAKSINISIN